MNAFLSSSMDMVVKKLGDLLEQESALPSSIRDDVRFLQVALGSMRSVILIRHCESLDDDSNPQTRAWVGRVRELAYDVEDWVDLFPLRAHAGGGGRKPSSSRLLRWLHRDAHKLTMLAVIADKHKSLKERAVELFERRKPYDGEAFPSVPRPIDPRPTTLFVDPGDLVGLDGPIEEVANMAMEAGNKARLKIVSIVGMAGSGKTTLANEVYQRLGRQNCFQCQAFVSVGLKQDLRETLTYMLSKLDNGHQVDGEIKNLIARLKETLKKRRYLVVVDDLWSEAVWETISRCFPDNYLGSRIIITTRNVAVATECDCIYNIGLLSEIDSTKLILNRAFGTGHGCPQDLGDLFPQITSRCGGLPLALVTVASILRDQYSMGEWKRLTGSRWLSISHPDAKVMKQVLILSYYDLPPDLQIFMLHLSIFPENYEVDTERIIRRMVAEGYVTVDARHTTVEETARSFLNELVKRNMVQPLHQKHSAFPRFCMAHPVIHDFIVCKSMAEEFVTLVNVQDYQYFPNNNHTVRRLSLQSSCNRDQAVPRNDYTQLSHVRSISVFGQASVTPPLTDLKMVRVLDLEGCDGPVCLDGLSTLLVLRYLSLRGTDVSELPATIGELRYLQFLDVRSTKLKELPTSIGALLHLRYLNLRDTDISDLPAAIGKLKCLETLDVRSTKVKELPPSILNLKHTLKTLLVGAKGLINLVETATRMPENIQNCHSLEELGTIDFREHHASFVMALGDLNRLRVLKITWSTQQSTERAYCEALVSSIKKWSQLESLIIHCGFLCTMEFLDSLPNPPRRLNKFKVTAGRFAAVPQWINGLGFLSFMQITVCKLGSDDLRVLRYLPKLKCLILGLEFIPRAAIVVENDGFDELTRFSVDCPVPWLIFRTRAMPKLAYLELKFCSGPLGLESVPYGIRNLQSLAEVVLSYNQIWCANSSSVKMTVEAVKKEVAKHRNPIELVINDSIINVQEVKEATEIHNEAARGGEAKDDAEVPGVGTSTSSEIEEIGDDAEHGL